MTGELLWESSKISPFAGMCLASSVALPAAGPATTTRVGKKRSLSHASTVRPRERESGG